MLTFIMEKRKRGEQNEFQEKGFKEE